MVVHWVGVVREAVLYELEDVVPALCDRGSFRVLDLPEKVNHRGKSWLKKVQGFPAQGLMVAGFPATPNRRHLRALFLDSAHCSWQMHDGAVHLPTGCS